MARSLSFFLGAFFALALLIVRVEAAPPIPTQVIFSNIQISSVSVDWQATTGTTIQFLVEVSSSAFAAPLSSTTMLLTSTFTALEVNTQYFTHVQAIDTVDGSSSAFTATISTYTLANAPVNLSTTAVSFSGISLSWDGSSNPAGTVFSVERSS